MGVYINGLEMPTTCGKCRIKNVIECDRWKLVRSVVLDRHRDCPLFPVSEPHGDLIDRSHLCDDSIGGDYGSGTRVYYAYEVEHAPVIIPASKEG